MPGPKPTPTAQLAARGSWLAKTRDDEPKPDLVRELMAPAELPERAAVIWAEMAPRLIGAGILTVADLPTFSRYCRLFAAWEDAMARVEATGDRSDVLTLKTLDELVRRLEAGFGLTPADRTRLSVAEETDEGKGRFFA